MARSKYIQSVLDAAKGRPKSTDWYRDKIKEFGEPSSYELIRDGRRGTKPFPGRLNMFVYDPKFKKKLPYYDTFPLVLPLENYSDGFLGLSFHSLDTFQCITSLHKIAHSLHLFTEASHEQA